MRFIIHLGTHKTGTTALQSFLSRNRKRLQKQRILYPRFAERDNAHHEFAWRISGRVDKGDIAVAPRVFVENFVREAESEGSESVILSSEEFEFIRGPSQIAQLGELLGGHDVLLIVYLRRQDFYLESEYGQHLRMYQTRETKTLMEFLCRYGLSDRFNYRRTLAPWSRVFGDENIRVRRYQRASFRGGSIFSDFADAASFETTSDWDLPAAQQSNQGVSALGAMALRVFNRIDLPSDRHFAVLNAIAEVERSENGLALLRERSCLLTPLQRTGLLAHFEGSNRDVARQYLGLDDNLFDYTVDEHCTSPADECITEFIARVGVVLSAQRKL